MSIFRPNYSKPGPGVNPDEPRRKGLFRFAELLDRDLLRFWQSGTLGMVGCLPWITALYEGISRDSLLLTALLCFLGGALAGPELTALTDTILRSLRDEPGFWWYTYRRVWRRNWKASLLPGGLLGLLLGVECTRLRSLLFGAFRLPAFTAVTCALILTLGTAVYFWLQLAVLELPFLTMMKNAVMLFFRFLPRSLLAVIFLIAYGTVLWLYAPLSFFALGAVNLWLPMVPALLAVYAPVEKLFDLENRLEKARKESDD